MPNRRFGVEIEYNDMTVEETRELLTDHNIAWQGEGSSYTTGPDAAWRVVRDSSLNDGSELNTPILSRDDPRSWESIKNVMEIICEHGSASLDDNAGVHVHVEVSDLSALSLLTIYTLTEHYTQGWIDLVGSRRGMRITREAGDEYFKQQLVNAITANGIEGHENLPTWINERDREGWWYDRHWPEGALAIHCHPYARQGTFEFRAHHCTLSGPRICDWTGFVLDFVEYCYWNPGIVPDDDGGMEALVDRVVSTDDLKWSLLNYPLPVHAVMR